MKKKLFSIILALCFMLPCAFMLTACNEDPDDPSTNPPGSISYTVTEAEWRTNLNLTKTIAQPQFASFTSTLTEITSYTVTAVGTSQGETGSATLKVAPNAMSIEFYKGSSTTLEDESGIYLNTDTLYQTLTQNLTMYFPFSNSYNDFTFDNTKNAYVISNFTVMMVNDYDPSQQQPVYTKSAEVQFVNGYLNTIIVELADSTFTDVYASFTFTFSNINNTTVTVAD